ERLPGSFGVAVMQIEPGGGGGVAIRADLLGRNDRARLIEAARAELGPITLLVNNAAFTARGRPPKPGSQEKAAARPPTTRTDGGRAPLAKVDWPTFLTTPIAAYERHFIIGPFAAYELMQRVAPDMAAAGYGSIINI